MTDRPTTRVQMELPERAFARLKRVKEITEASSYAEVIRNALIHYEAMLANGEFHINGVPVGEPAKAGKMKTEAA